MLLSSSAANYYTDIVDTDMAQLLQTYVCNGWRSGETSYPVKYKLL